MADVYVTIYTKEKGRLSFSIFEWNKGTTQADIAKLSFHREDGPTVEYTNGSKCWHKDGKLHREDGPAIEWVNGTGEWYKDGTLLFSLPKAYLINYMKLKNLTLAHLLTDPDPMIRKSVHKYKWEEAMTDVHVTIFTKERGKLELTQEEWNRFDTSKLTCHRIDGPALFFENGAKYWYINDMEVPERVYEGIVRLLRAYPLELRVTDPAVWIRDFTIF